MFGNNSVRFPDVELIEESYTSCPHCLSVLHHVDMGECDGKRLVCDNCPGDYVSDGDTDRYHSFEGPRMDCAVCLNEVRDYCYVERNGTLEVDATQSDRFKCSECTEGPVPDEDVDLSEVRDI
jgi:hypothetical protein